MTGKKRGLGKGVEALFSVGVDKVQEQTEVSTTGSESSKAENSVSQAQTLGSDEANEASKAELPSPEVEQAKPKSMGRSKAKAESYDSEIMRSAIKEAELNPRVTLWSPISTAILKYLRKTQPEFSISEEASSILEQGIAKKYPQLYKDIKKEKKKA